MIEGVGIDVVEVARIERAMRRAGFVERILTEAERSVIRTPGRVAGRWAAKEAISKALGCPLNWHDVEILPDSTGAPQVSVRGGFESRRIHLSITHERGHAAAVAIIESEAPSPPQPSNRRS